MTVEMLTLFLDHDVKISTQVFPIYIFVKSCLLHVFRKTSSHKVALLQLYQSFIAITSYDHPLCKSLSMAV